MTSAIFEFFELIVDEFQGKNEVFFGIGRMQDRAGKPSALFLDLKKQLKQSVDARVIPSAVKAIHDHFSARTQVRPFKFENSTSRFHSPNEDFFEFVRTSKQMRSLPKKAKEFELLIMERLSERLPGDIHRVGFPRDRLKKRDQFNDHLKKHFGFKSDIALGKEKDGGFDILWKIPLGAPPFSPIVSIQCKNGDYSLSQAAVSLGASRVSLNQHHYLHKDVHVNCIVFNDYLVPEALFPKGVEYVPVGLSDLINKRIPRAALGI